MRAWVPPTVGAVAFLLVSTSILLAPAAAGRAAEDVALVPARFLQPPGRDAYESWVTRSVDAGVRSFSMGDPDRLVQARLHLENATPQPGAWHGQRSLELAWNDLGHDAIRYELRLGPSAAGFASAQLLATVARPRANVTAPGDGSFDVWIRPVAGRPGAPTAFGPFRIDTSPPPTPRLTAPPAPPGYRFELTWTPSMDDSGILGYELERRRDGATWSRLPWVFGLSHVEDPVGNGDYAYRVRAINGARVPSAWSDEARVSVRAPMTDPGPGSYDYGVHANYTGFLHLWDLSDPDRHVRVDDVPAPLRDAYLKAEPAIETDNTTLQAIVRGLVGGERNTLRIAERLFEYLFNETDYDADKLQADFDPDDPNGGLQRAGQTLDRGRGICGDLAVLYVTLLRIAGVPARPVHGYLDNARAGVGGFHMWAEVYVGPVGHAYAWMPVDVSGVNGPYRPEWLYAYLGLANPDYLALGEERDYTRFGDAQWNAWARYGYKRFGSEPKPTIEDRTRVVEYEQELGRLYFNPATRRTTYRACTSPDPGQPDDPCPSEPAPPGFTKYYGIKGVAKKRIDYGADVTEPLPGCVRAEFRVPLVDEAAAVTPDQSALHHVYTRSATAHVGAVDDAGWVRFLDGPRWDACA